MVKIKKYTEINIEDISLEDSTFGFSFPQELDNLTESIKKTGLIQPIILHQNKIVCGRRRILSCKKLGFKNLPAGIIEDKFPEIEIFRLNLEDNLSIRELNIIEKSCILNKLTNIFQVPQETLIKEYLPLLNIPAHKTHLNKYIWLNALPDKLKELIINRKVTLDTLNITAHWPTDTKEEILTLVLSFGFGNNKIGEILSLLNDISLRDNIIPTKDKEWVTVKNNPQISPYQKGIWLKNYLLKKRYPAHTEFKDKAKDLIAKLNLPENISIELNDLLTWEHDSINLKLKCKKKEDLEHSIKKLNSMGTSRELSELLNMLTIL